MLFKHVRDENVLYKELVLNTLLWKPVVSAPLYIRTCTVPYRTKKKEKEGKKKNFFHTQHTYIEYKKSSAYLNSLGNWMNEMVKKKKKEVIKMCSGLVVSNI